VATVWERVHGSREALIVVVLVSIYTALQSLFLRPKTSTLSATDLKTILSSAWCLSHRINAYDPANIRAVYRAAGFMLPETWFGHAAVYPPVTLVLLSPFTWIPTSIALFLLFGIWSVFLVVAVNALMRYAGTQFHLNSPDRFLLAFVFLCSPYLMALIALGNLGAPAVCLAICGFVLRGNRSPWPAAVALGFALALKPHVAFWVLVPLLLLPSARSRKVALRSLAVLAGLILLTLFDLALTHQLWLQMHAYRSILLSETSGDSSMSPATREISSLTVQITSLKSLVGFWHALGFFASLMCDLAIVACAGASVILTRKAKNESQALLSATMWIALGLVATYHRAYDGMMLCLALPVVFAKLMNHAQRWKGIALTVFLLAMSFGPAGLTVFALTDGGQSHSLASFLLMRQAALVDSSLALFLLFLLWREIQGEPTSEWLRPLDAGRPGTPAGS